ncbi:MAG TPA: hypothetical protein VHG09_15135, partial [Longimicrobiales bacterium]|nr:hypothetical protein [Longimicrobiales bacterium]
MTALVAPALPLSVPLASTRFSSASIIALTVVAAGASACGRASIEPTTVRDSAGVAIVESHEHAWEASAAWSVDPVPILDLAATASGSTNDFFRVSNAIRRADGSIVVASRGSSTVSAYAPTGELLFSHGRAGDGPGEYRRLTSVAPYRGDSLVAFDYWQQRLTILDADGTHTRVTTMEVPGGRAYTLHPVTDGRFVLRVNAFDQLRDPIGRKRIPQPLLVIHADGTVGDTVAVAAGFETFFFDGGDAAIPFGRESFIGTRGDTVIVGDADHLGFREYTLDGQLQRIVRVPDFPLA